MRSPTPPDADTILAHLPDPVVVVDQRGGIVWGNQRATEEFGLDLATARRTSLTSLIHPSDLFTALVSLRSVQEKDVGTLVEIRIRDRQGAWARYESRGWSGVDDPAVRGVVVVLRRIGDRGQWSIAGGDSRRLTSLLDYSPGLILVIDADGRVESANRALSSTLGISLEETLGRHLTDLLVPGDRAAVRAAIRAIVAEGGARSFEAAFQAGPGGEPIPFGLTTVNLLDDPDIGGLVVSGVDIAALVEARAELAHRATHDPLTGLPNRLLLLEHLDLVLRAATGSGERIGVVYCDIDRFKVINDAYGHSVGDEVLIEVAQRIGCVLGPDDTAGRMGGDEFVVVARRPAPAEVGALAARITQLMGRPIATRAGAVPVAISAGWAMAGPGMRADELLRDADKAMYIQKRLSRAAPDAGRRA